MTNQINTLISQHLTEEGYCFYWMIQNSITKTGDEANIRTTIWINNRDTGTDEDHRRLSELDNLIIKLEIEHPDWIKIAETGMMKHWEHPESHDWIRLQLTDTSIYLIEMNSGQY